MCGRYASSSRPEDLVEAFEVDDDRTGEVARSILVTPQNPPAGQPDFNMAPTKQAPVVLTRAVRGDADAAPVRQLRLLTWGLVPSWSKEVKLGLRMTNARSESLLDTSSFARAAAARRCLVPADGTRHRRAAAALAKDDVSRSDSERALVIRSPSLTSLDQLGTSPHVNSRSWRTGAASASPRTARVRTTGACLVGAMLKSGWRAGGF